jgi:hypothetical protein
MSKIDQYPEWVQKHKTKGTTVRKTSVGSYVLFNVSSKRVNGKKYPVLIQEYVGIITEDGIIPKKTTLNNKTIYIEYGLSKFIFSNFHRSILRHISSSEGNENKEMIFICSILHYIFGSYDDDILKLSFISNNFTIKKEYLTPRRISLIITLSNKICEAIKIKISDPRDNMLIQGMLRNILINVETKTILNHSDEINTLLSKYNLLTL